MNKRLNREFPGGPAWAGSYIVARSPRSKCYKTALISSQHTMSTTRGVVRDSSKNGVKLEVEDIQAIPQRFQLEVLRDRYIVDCSIRWREGNMIGVEFECDPVEVPRLNAKQEK